MLHLEQELVVQVAREKFLLEEAGEGFPVLECLGRREESAPVVTHGQLSPFDGEGVR